MFEYFLANPPAIKWPASLDKLVSAGAPLSGETVRAFFEKFAIKIHSFYGTSESGGIAFDSSDSSAVADTVGWPLPGVIITLCPDDDAPEGSGRVHIRNAGVADGYHGGPSEEFRDGGFLSGDYGTFDREGRLCLTGRASSFINVAGKKVQPTEVEDVLRQMPGVRDVRVLAAADAQRGEQVAACIVTERSPTLSTLAVRRFCSARLAAFKIPRIIVFLEVIPLTARGKVDRRALEEAIKGTIAGFPEQLC
jgi:long-chain acyl-CoA synthetase